MAEWVDMNPDTKRRGDYQLRAVSGPTAVTFPLRPPGPATIGRRSTSTLQLDHAAVSREHARLSFRSASEPNASIEGVWLLDDMSSSRGTWLNSVRLKPNRQYHLRPGDLIVIGPWTLQVVDPDIFTQGGSPRTTFAAVDDTALVETVLTRIEPPAEATLPHERLRLLLHCSEQIHAARTEEAVVEAVLDAAVAGTSFARAAVLRPMSDDDVIEVMASRGGGSELHDIPWLCRALIREAADGGPAMLTRKDHVPCEAEPTGRVEALCVPITVESTLAGFLYLDQSARAAPPVQQPAGSKPVPDRVVQAEASASTFPAGLARLAAMGMAGLMRIDIERRQERIEAELQAAVEAQQWLLPQRQGTAGPLTYIGASKQGQCVGGDFYDIIPLSNERLAVIMGDVGGKGIPVSVLVSASQGFLHASMEQQEDPVRAVTSLNHLYHSRISHARFLKLWIGLFDPNQQALTYVDAGHGYAMTAHADGRCELLPTGSHPPIGMERDVEYRAQVTVLTPGARTCIVSDGFVEQLSHDAQADLGDGSQSARGSEAGGTDQPQRFGASSVQRCLRKACSQGDEILALFDALERHAGTTGLDDDATAVVIRW